MFGKIPLFGSNGEDLEVITINMRSSQRGFTLAEVLISLALLAVIATFTIPKILNSIGQAEAAGKVRETVASLEQVWYGEKLSGSVIWGATSCNSQTGGVGTEDCSLYTNILYKLNVVAAEPNGGNSFSTGCRSLDPLNSMRGFVQFANGVTVQGLNNTMNPLPPIAGGVRSNYIICIDINGVNSPNTLGSDVFLGNFNPGGQFDGSNATVQSIQGKNFFWGNGALSGVYTTSGTIGTSVNNNTTPPVTTATVGTVHSLLTQ